MMCDSGTQKICGTYNYIALLCKILTLADRNFHQAEEVIFSFDAKEILKSAEMVHFWRQKTEKLSICDWNWKTQSRIACCLHENWKHYMYIRDKVFLDQLGPLKTCLGTLIIYWNPWIWEP